MLNLADNLLTGSLSDFTMPGNSVAPSLALNVSRNAFNDGPLPPAWHSATLQVRTAHNAQRTAHAGLGLGRGRAAWRRALL